MTEKEGENDPIVSKEIQHKQSNEIDSKSINHTNNTINK